MFLHVSERTILFGPNIPPRLRNHKIRESASQGFQTCGVSIFPNMFNLQGICNFLPCIISIKIVFFNLRQF